MTLDRGILNNNKIEIKVKNNNVPFERHYNLVKLIHKYVPLVLNLYMLEVGVDIPKEIGKVPQGNHPDKQG